MNTFAKVIGALTVPLLLISVFGELGAAIWLAVLREWRLLVYGIGVPFSGVLFLSIALMLGLLLDLPATLLHRKGYRVASWVLFFLSMCYTLALLAVWCLTVLFFFAERAGNRSFTPALLFSYGAAMAPVAWLARKDNQKHGNPYETITAFFCQMAYILMVLAALFLGGVPIMLSFAVFAIAMLAALVINIRLATLQGSL